MKKYFLFFLAASALIVIVFVTSFSRPLPISEVDNDLVSACSTSDLSGLIDFEDRVAVYDGRQLPIPQIALANDTVNVLSFSTGERWIEVDLSDQKLKAWEGDTLYLETPVSTGLSWWPTPTGEFRIWIKLRATKMEGGSGRYYYYLPNVPYVMFFENENLPGWRGYGLHGTYWHDDFGTPRSHGCVNLPTEIAKELYHWVSPNLPEGRSVVYSSNDNPGTRVVIHD